MDATQAVRGTSVSIHGLQRRMAAGNPGGNDGRQQGDHNDYQADDCPAIRAGGGIDDAAQTRHGIHGFDVGSKVQAAAGKVGGHDQPKDQAEGVTYQGHQRRFQQHQLHHARTRGAHRHHDTELPATLYDRHQDGVGNSCSHHHKHYKDDDVGHGIVKVHHLHKRRHQLRPTQNFYLSRL